MPIKKDGTGKRWVEMELLVPGSPEQVWHAMATGSGNAGWFVPAQIEPEVGGRVLLDFGEGATSSGEVTAWEPPRTFGYVERDWAPGAPPVATEIHITSRAGDRCVIRMTHALFSETDDWDDQIEGFESGWPGFFALLKLYLAHFAGQPAGSFMTMMPVKTNVLTTWRRLVQETGLDAANVGERRVCEATPERLTGVIERVYQDTTQRYVILRLDSPSPGIVLVGVYDKGATSHEAAGAHVNVSLCRYYYGPGAPEQVEGGRALWKAWLQRFAE